MGYFNAIPQSLCLFFCVPACSGKLLFFAFISIKTEHKLLAGFMKPASQESVVPIKHFLRHHVTNHIWLFDDVIKSVPYVVFCPLSEWLTVFVFTHSHHRISEKMGWMGWLLAGGRKDYK